MTLELEAPTSKSMTQRALVIAALSEGPTEIVDPLVCDDSRYLSLLLTGLGCDVTWSGRTLVVKPAPLRGSGATIHCGNAGTAVRFGACLALVATGPFVLDGDAHMRERPMGALGDALERLGVSVRYPRRPGCPPVMLERVGPAPPSVQVDGSLSSQYASGLLMVAPKLDRGLCIALTGRLVSRPYLDMTMAMMRAAGAEIVEDDGALCVEPGGYRGGERARSITVEPDWSAAAFLLAAARVARVDVEVRGLLRAGSLQGDRVFVEMLAALDEPAASPFEVDLTDTPDLIAPLAAMAPFAARPTRIRGASHARVKECDRVAVLSSELGKLGIEVHQREDGLDIEPLSLLTDTDVELDPHDDHRMAMAFGVLSLRMPSIRVKSRECVTKSFPDFWTILERIRAR